MYRLVSEMGQGIALWLAVCLPGSVALVAARGRAGLPRVRRLLLRLAPVAVFYSGYAWLIGWTARPEVVRTALHHGVAIVHLERLLHIAWEPTLSSLTVPYASAYYDWAQVFVTVGLLSYLAAVEGDVFWRCSRNALALIGVGGFLTFWLYPVSPPWLLPASFGIHSEGLANLRGVGDLLGAMPSLHTAWAAWACMVLWAILPGRWWLLGLANLGLTMFVVLATGNHYVLDVVAGEALAFAAMWCADRWEGIAHAGENRISRGRNAGVSLPGKPGSPVAA